MSEIHEDLGDCHSERARPDELFIGELGDEEQLLCADPLAHGPEPRQKAPAGRRPIPTKLARAIGCSYILGTSELDQIDGTLVMSGNSSSKSKG